MPIFGGFLAQNSWTTLSVSMLVSLYAYRSASPESLCSNSRHWHKDPRRRLSARAKSCDIRLYCTLNVKLECRSAAGLCLEELHAIVDTLGKHLEYENTQKRLTFFFNLAIRKKKSPQNLLSVYLTNLHSGTPLQMCYLNELKDGRW